MNIFKKKEFWTAFMGGMLAILIGNSLLANASLRSAGTSYRDFNWSDMPRGTLCGLYMVTQSTVRANVRCQGRQVGSSCPPGFARADLGYFEAGGGARALVTCVKP